MADSKVGNYLEENQGEQLTPTISRAVLSSILLDLLESDSVSQVVGNWFGDWLALRLTASEPAAQPSDAHGEPQPEGKPRPNLAPTPKNPYPATPGKGK